LCVLKRQGWPFSEWMGWLPQAQEKREGLANMHNKGKGLQTCKSKVYKHA